VTDIVLRGSFDTSQQRRYVHVPFAVPPGVGALHISYDYSDRIPSDPRLHGGNTLDIGLVRPTRYRAIQPGSPWLERQLRYPRDLGRTDLSGELARARVEQFARAALPDAQD